MALIVAIGIPYYEKVKKNQLDYYMNSIEAVSHIIKDFLQDKKTVSKVISERTRMYQMLNDYNKGTETVYFFDFSIFNTSIFDDDFFNFSLDNYPVVKDKNSAKKLFPYYFHSAIDTMDGKNTHRDILLRCMFAEIHYFKFYKIMETIELAKEKDFSSE